MKRTLRFVLVLLALLAVMGMAQGAMVGACSGDSSVGILLCPD